MNKNKPADWWCKGKPFPGAVKVFALIATRLALSQGGVKLKGDR